MSFERSPPPHHHHTSLATGVLSPMGYRDPQCPFVTTQRECVNRGCRGVLRSKWHFPASGSQNNNHLLGLSSCFWKMYGYIDLYTEEIYT